MRSVLRWWAFGVVASGVLPAILAAQARVQVRVTRDQAIIWQTNFVTMATLVNRGTLLEVVARRDDWIEVVLPVQTGPTRATGMIAAAAVETVAPSPSAQAPQSTRPPPPRPPAPDSGLRGFGDVGYGRFAADRSFDAIVGTPGGFWYGGGAEFRARSGFFVPGSFERYRRTGERAFVFEGEVFKLGVPDTLSITPVSVSAGYRFARRSAIPYIGGGVGRYFYREDFKSADESEKVKQDFGSYHALGGVEWRNSRWL